MAVGTMLIVGIVASVIHTRNGAGRPVDAAVATATPVVSQEPARLS